MKSLSKIIIILLLVSCSPDTDFQCVCVPTETPDGKTVNMRGCHDGTVMVTDGKTKLSYEQALALANKQGCPQ